MVDVNVLITGLRELLSKDDLYSTKDELLLTMLGNAYTLYRDATMSCEHDGVTTSYTSQRGAQIDKVTPSYTVMLEQSKEIFKYLTALYLTPASRKMMELSKLNKTVNPFDALTKALAKASEEDDEVDEIVEEVSNDNRTSKRKTS